MRKLLPLLLLAAVPAWGAISDDLKAQWDVNTRTRTDNDFYEHVNGVVAASTGTPTVVSDGTEDALNYDGSTEYTEISTWPTGLSTTFADSDYTIAARVKLDNVNRAAFESIFGAFENGNNGLRVHLVSETGTGQGLGAHSDGGAGADVFLDGGVSGEIDDGAFHVIAQRRSGNVFTLWVDGVQVATDTVAAGTVGVLDRIGFAGRTDGAVDWPLDGSITWGAVWDVAKSDADIQALDDATNPFLSTTVTLSDATPDIDTTFTATLSGAFSAGGNPTTATFASGDTVACSSATSTTCDIPIAFTDLVASGALGSTQVETATTLTITNGTETSQSTAVNIQIPESGYDIVDLTCTAGVDCSDDSEAISPMTTGDDCAIKVLSGTLDHLSTECAPVFNTSSFSYTVAQYDESATAWLGQETVTVTSPNTDACRGVVGNVVYDILQNILKEMSCKR